MYGTDLKKGGVFKKGWGMGAEHISLPGFKCFPFMDPTVENPIFYNIANSG